MDGDTLMRETMMVLIGGLGFIEKVPDNLSQDLIKSRDQMKISFEFVLEKWQRVKSIEPKVEVETLKNKRSKQIRKLSTTKKRSNSVGNLVDSKDMSESYYVNLTSLLHTEVSTSIKPSKKKKQQKYFSLDTHYAPRNTTSNIPSVDDTLITRYSDVFPAEMTDFTMVSNGKFQMIESCVSLQSGKNKAFVKNLYCCLQNIFILFGPRLTYTPPLAVINLEQCVIVQAVKNEIQLKESDAMYTIRFPKEDQAKLWADKIRKISPYTYVRDFTIDAALPLSCDSVEEGDLNYSYVRQERIIGGNTSEYSYIPSLSCRDCQQSVGKKISTAEAVIDSSYINTFSKPTSGVKNLISQFNQK
ncbi:hypothetical protein LOD99_1 [Oopsacas minuta]|uniref:PH domain-containing protein n=1 Tax=Oopsacas minuta TaxID=111878 RepID=A0AAV7K7V2_9METZ|nr:hypothetical protein LOD99_1 [Oopsacas minuta]